MSVTAQHAGSTSQESLPPTPSSVAGAQGPTTPGALRSETHLVLQTRHSQRLVEGRSGEDGKQRIVGLIQFAALSRSVWNGALADDPYAHWWLLQMHDAIEEARSEMKSLNRHVYGLLQGMPGVTVTVAQSVEPVRIPLTFTNPYGFRGAYLLAHLDELVRAILTARHVALIDRDTNERLLDDAGRQVRRAFNAVLRYRFLGINADDIRLMTARGKEAEALMGTVPADILEGRMRAPHAPDPRARGFAIPMALRRRAPGPKPGPASAAVAEASDGADAAPTDGADHARAP